MAKKTKANGPITLPDLESLRARLVADRLRRGMTWQEYAKLLGVGFTTLNRIARGQSKKPHDTTVYQIVSRLEELAS